MPSGGSQSIRRARPQRFESLDGARGLAALSVLIGHAFWMTPQFSQAVQLANAGNADLFTSVLTYTPLHLAWLAREAVIVFFVLSGFVLVLPFLTRSANYVAYYPSRLVRLMLPAWAALVLAYGIAVVTYPSSGHASSTLLDDQVGPDATLSAFSGFWLIGGVPDVLPPLWSLEWELLFSLLLPLYVMIARWTVGPWRSIAVMGACVVASAAGTFLEVGALEYLPVFMLGSVIASNLAMVNRILNTHLAMWVGIGSLLALCAGWYPRGFSDSVALTAAGQVLALIGAAGVVVAAISWRGFVTVLSDSTIVHWLGSRSFSLYLVHFPVIMAAAFLTMGEHLAVTLLIGVPVSLGLSELFYRGVERPSMRLARAVKVRLSTPTGRPVAR